MKRLLVWLGRAFGLLWKILDGMRKALANLLVLMAAIAGIAFVCMHRAPAVPEHSVLDIALSGSVVEAPRFGGREAELMMALRGREPETVLADVVDALDYARKDARIDGVLLRVADLEGIGLASVHEIASAMDRFRQSGKKITVWATSMNQRQYAVASHASEVFIHPMGEVGLSGLGNARLYWGDALRRLGVRVHVFKAGDFKSYPEAFVRNAPSQEALQADRFWLDDAWRQMTGLIESGRKLPSGAVNRWIDALPELLQAKSGDMAAVARDAHLIEGACQAHEVREMLGKRHPAAKGKDGKLHFVNYLDFLAVSDPEPSSDKGIGVVTLEGEIGEGESDLGQVGARTAVSAINSAREDPAVAALVVRVNSPGGSALASELIRQALERVRAAGKPVVMSFGDMAASGGYWLSMSADRIVADPMTITGSIGVFGVTPTFEETLGKLSIGAGGATTTWLADARSPTKSMNPRLASMLEMSVSRTYREFVSLVSRARKLPEARVKELAQGRVYTGRQAKDLGLVDELGGYLDARKAAIRLAKLPEDAPVYVLNEEPSDVVFWLLHLLTKTAVLFRLDTLAHNWLGQARPVLSILSNTKGNPFVHAHCLVVNPL